MTSYEELEGLVATPVAHPMFAMSQGSRELFHSNLLGWCLEKYGTLGATLLEVWKEPGGLDGSVAEVDVRRERRHPHPSIVAAARRPLVVENKMFSLRYASQLDAYATDLVRHLEGNPDLVLLSLTSPGWPDGRWTRSFGQTWVLAARRIAE